MAINRASTKKQLQEGLNAVWGLESKQYPDLWKDFCKVTKESSKAYIEDVLMSGLGAASVKEEGAAVAYDTASEGYVSRYIFETVALAVAITEEAQEDNLYMDLSAKMTRALAKSQAYTKNVKGANLLNNAFSASYTGGDGVALLSASHPLKSGGTQSNLVTAADLSETSLEDAMILLGTFVDDRGIPCMVAGKKLIVANANQFVAKKILGTPLAVDSADNTINVINKEGLLSLSVNRFLTDDDAWFVTTDAEQGIQCIDRVAPGVKLEGDFESGNMRIKSRARYVFGWTNFRSIVGSAGA